MASSINDQVPAVTKTNGNLVSPKDKENKKMENEEMTQKMFARIPFRYGGDELERGEIFVPKGLPRDAQLLGLGYYSLYDKHEHHDLMCDSCGKHFINDGFYVAHKKKAGGCLAPSPPINRVETAALLNVDPKKLVMDEV